MSWLFAISLFAAVLPPAVQPAVEQAMDALEAELPAGAELEGVSIEAERVQVRLKLGPQQLDFVLVEAGEPGPGRWFAAEGPPGSEPWSTAFITALHAGLPDDPWIRSNAAPAALPAVLERHPARPIAPWRSRLAALLWLLLCLAGTVWALRARPDSGTMPP